MNLASQICFWVPFIGIEIILIVLLYFWIKKKELFQRFLRLALILEIILVIFSWFSQIFLSYLYLRTSSELGQFLVSGKGSFFINQSFYLSKDYLWAFGIALGFYFISLLILKYQKKPILDENVPRTIFIAVLAWNFLRLLNFIPGLILAFLLAIIWQFILIATGRRTTQDRLAITPFLLASAAIIQVLTLFSFYSKLLIFFHLI